jgi:hypothetical protein
MPVLLSDGDITFENDSLLGYCAVQSRRSSPTFQWCLLLPSSGLIALVMEAASTSETSLNIYESKRRNIPGVYSFHTHRRENLKCHDITYSSGIFGDSSTPAPLHF